MEFNFTAIIQSVTDAVLVSDSEQELKEIIKYRKKYIILNKEFTKIENDVYKTNIKYPDNESLDSKTLEWYKTFKEPKERMKSVLATQNDFFLNFCLNYFSKKRDDYLKNISLYRSEIKLLSNKMKISFFQLAEFVIRSSKNISESKYNILKREEENAQ